MVELVTKEEVLEVVKEKGPVMPLEIKREIGKGDSMIIGAVLSQLYSNQEIKMTKVKKGGSPFYYLKGQEEQLLELKTYLGEKDKMTFDLLKEKKVLRDKVQEPLIRVSCRNIPDFAKKINVNVSGEKELFWKWYLLSDEEALEEIRKLFKSKDSVKSKTETSTKEQPQESNQKYQTHREKTQEKPMQKDQIKTNNESQSRIQEEDGSNFEIKLKNYFQEKGIKSLEKENIRKNSEYEFVVEMQTPLGKGMFLCKAKNKKKTNDSDLSEAYMKGQLKNLPVIYLTTGELTKKSEEKLNTDFKGLIIAKI